MQKIEPDIRHHNKVRTFCSNPHNKVILNSWGDVSMCCYQMVQLGRLNERTEILDLWRGSLAKEIRRETSEGNLHLVCNKGTACPYKVKEKEMVSVTTYKDSFYPTWLEICLPDRHCNIGGYEPSEENPACIMCIRNFVKPQQQDLTDFLCDKARPLMPYLNQFSVLGIAEPFWKDAAFQIMDKVGFQFEKHHIQFTTNTNGTCLNEKICRKFFNYVDFSDISWSLDAATPETHVKIRRLDALDLVVKNLKRWIEIRKEIGRERNHRVTIYNNINLLNVHEMTLMVEMAAKVGVDAITMLPTYDQAGLVNLGELVLCDKNVSIFKENAEKAKERATELGVNLQYIKDFDVAPLVDRSEVLEAHHEAHALVQLQVPM